MNKNEEKLIKKEQDQLRRVIKLGEKRIAKRFLEVEDNKNIINIVEEFLKKGNFICYGGIAINNILPENYQFYDLNIEFPDYDFFSPDALNECIKLADKYFKKGFTEVYATSGVHKGTYKLFVNFIPVADITQLDRRLFNNLKKNAIIINKITYCPPDYLRMLLYVELSRPRGDIKRWEKLVKRLNLLNKFYPIPKNNCKKLNIFRNFEDKKLSKTIFEVLLNTFQINKVLFFGSFALNFYIKLMPNYFKKDKNFTPDFEIIAEEPNLIINLLKEEFKNLSIGNLKVKEYEGIGEIIPKHYELIFKNETIAFIYKSESCYNYNNIRFMDKLYKIATIETILSFYLSFLYSNNKYYNRERIMCIASYLFILRNKNRFTKFGLVKKYSLNCYGYQIPIEEIRANKTKKYKELKNKKNTKEYKELFLKYIPS